MQYHIACTILHNFIILYVSAAVINIIHASALCHIYCIWIITILLIHFAVACRNNVFYVSHAFLLYFPLKSIKKNVNLIKKKLIPYTFSFEILHSKLGILTEYFKRSNYETRMSLWHRNFSHANYHPPVKSSLITWWRLRSLTLLKMSTKHSYRKHLQ